MANALLYCQSGGGKTVNSTKVEGKKNLLMCSDNSQVVLNNPEFKRDNLDIKIIITYEEFLNDFETAVESKKYENIIIDNLSDIFDLAILEMEASGKYKDMRKAYLIVYQALKRLARKSGQVGCNVLFTCWETFDDDIVMPDGSIGKRIKPRLPEKIIDSILGLCNVVGRIENKLGSDGKVHYYYNYSGSAKMYGKDQLFNRKYGKPENIFNGKDKGEM